MQQGVEFQSNVIFKDFWRILNLNMRVKVSKEANIRNRYNQVHVPYLTQRTRWESDINLIKRNIQERQEASPFPAGDHKAAINKQESMPNTKHK